MADTKNSKREKSQATSKSTKTDIKKKTTKADSNNRNIKSKKKKKDGPKYIKILKNIFLSIFILGILFSTVAIGYAFAIIKTAPELDVNAITNLNQQSIVLDSSGNLIDNIPTEEIRTKIGLDDMPEHLKNAYIAIEDERFYKHKGIDIKRILGAAYRDVKNIITGTDGLHGASTMTQQVIKNTVLTNEVSIKRKVREIYLALKLEKKLSKDEILAQYLNTIPLSGKIYGVEEGAKYFFDKSAKDLSLIESAYLAGITQAPSAYSAFNEKNIEDPVAYLDRTKTVLMKMRDLGYITQEEYDVAYADVDQNKFEFSKTEVSYRLKDEWFVLPAIEQVKEDLKEKYKYTDDEISKLMLNGGLKIYTTMDRNLQDSTQEILNDRSNIANSHDGGEDVLDENGVPLLQASAVIMDYRNGHVKALIGGRGDQPAHSLNRASDALRPIASNTKPLTVFGPAIDTKIMTAASPIDDAPLPKSIADKYQPGWDLNNFNYKFDGIINPRESITWSKNIASVITEDTIGLKTGLAYGEKLGIKYNSHSASSIAALALGQHDNRAEDLDGGNPLILASAFGTFGNNGNRSEPVFYTKVEDSTGKVLLESNSEQIPVFSPETSYIMYDLLKGPVSKFDGGLAKFGDGTMPVAGKTGTSTKDVDWWFSGLTPYYSGSVWVGYDNKREMEGFGFSSAAAKLWGLIMGPAHEGLEVTDLEKPSGIVTALVCKDSGKKPTDLCSRDQRGSRVVSEMFIAGTEPTAVCDVHVTAKVNKNNNKLATDNTPKGLIEERVFIKKANANPASADYKYVLPTEKDDSKAEVVKPTITPPAENEPEKNSSPELIGLADKTIKVGETFDLMAGVTAKDKEDGDLTSKITVSGGPIDTSAAGIHKLTYSVTDSKNKTVTKQITITIVADETEPVE